MALYNYQLILDQGMNQEMLAEKLGTRAPYVSMFITGHGSIPRKDWQKLYDYFSELRAKAA